MIAGLFKCEIAAEGVIGGGGEVQSSPVGYSSLRDGSSIYDIFCRHYGVLEPDADSFSISGNNGSDAIRCFFKEENARMRRSSSWSLLGHSTFVTATPSRCVVKWKPPLVSSLVFFRRHHCASSSIAILY